MKSRRLSGEVEVGFLNESKLRDLVFCRAVQVRQSSNNKKVLLRFVAGASFMKMESGR